MRPELTMTVTEQEGARAAVSVSGEIDMHTAPDLDRTLNELITEGTRQLVVDLTEVGFCDSTGLAAFLHARECIHAHTEGKVVLVGMGPTVAKVFGITGLTELFERHEALPAALAGARTPAPGHSASNQPR